MGKATKAEAMNRLREVTKLLLAGAEFAEIRQFAAERQWGITDRSIRRYMEGAINGWPTPRSGTIRNCSAGT
jgi:hypothetical protein